MRWLQPAAIWNTIWMATRSAEEAISRLQQQLQPCWPIWKRTDGGACKQHPQEDSQQLLNTLAVQLQDNDIKASRRRRAVPCPGRPRRG
jgi:hypothetical protein